MKEKLLLTVLLLALTVSSAQAAITTYTNQADFLAAISGMTQDTLDFDGMTAGQLPNGSTVNGVTLSSNAIDLLNNTEYPLYIGNNWETTSGKNYLGLDDDFAYAFMLGDSLFMDFARPMRAIGLYVTVDDFNIFYATDFELRAGNGTAMIDPNSFVALTDGRAFFLGIVEDDPAFAFLGAELWSASAGAGLFFNVDDITTAVPIPGTFLLLWAGLTGLFFRKQRKLKA